MTVGPVLCVPVARPSAATGAPPPPGRPAAGPSSIGVREQIEWSAASEISSRSSYASAGLVNATGWHEVKVISERFGHTNVAITIDTSSHVLPAADVETAHTLAELIHGGP